MLIEDGQGTGFTAGVNAENRLKTIAITSSIEHHINHVEGNAYSFITQQTPTASNPSGTLSGDICFAYIKNTSTLNIVLE